MGGTTYVYRSIQEAPKEMEHNINTKTKNNRIRTYDPEFKFSTKSNNEQFSISNWALNQCKRGFNKVLSQFFGREVFHLRSFARHLPIVFIITSSYRTFSVYHSSPYNNQSKNPGINKNIKRMEFFFFC